MEVEVLPSAEQSKSQDPWGTDSGDNPDAGKSRRSRPASGMPGQVVSTLFFPQGAPPPAPTEAGSFEPDRNVPLGDAFAGSIPQTTAKEADPIKTEVSESRIASEKSRQKPRKQASKGAGSVPNVFFQ